MTRKKLDGLNDSMNRPRTSLRNPASIHKVNMHNYYELNRPPTGSGRIRLRDNYLPHQRMQSPMAHDLDTIELMANQSAYSMVGTPLKDNDPVIESLPPKSPTPPPPHIDLHNDNQNYPKMGIQNLSLLVQNFQDKIELEFKAQMSIAKDELMFMQIQITDK